MTNPETIPCLSLWQPWATLMALGMKRNETRSWRTSLRGPLAIQAAQKWTRELADCCQLPAFRKALGDAELPRGVIVCVVNVVDCVPTTIIRPSAMEREFGLYTPGRFAFVTDSVRPLANPIAVRAFQGIFNLSPEITARVMEQIHADPSRHPRIVRNRQRVGRSLFDV